MSLSIEQAERRLKRADRLVSIGKGLFVAYFVVVSIVLMVQLYYVQQSQQASLQKSIEDNSKQHERTQEYVKCIASALLVPLAQRSANVFDKCGITTSSSTSSQTGQSPSHISVTSTANPVSPKPADQNAAPTTPQPTTSSPPDPSTPSPIHAQVKLDLSPISNALTQRR